MNFICLGSLGCFYGFLQGTLPKTNDQLLKYKYYDIFLLLFPLKRRTLQILINIWETSD